LSLVVGNVYESKDRRERGRRVRVVAVEGARAVCEPVNAREGRTASQTRISLKALSKRWRCVMYDPPKGGV
jgi:hypothetical protein